MPCYWLIDWSLENNAVQTGANGTDFWRMHQQKLILRNKAVG
jgi:hypothetical protein